MEASLHTFTGVEPRDELIVDLLRTDVSASVSVLRHTCVRRVNQALRGNEELRERIFALCERLEIDGDFNRSKGGVLNATPLRLVQVGDGRYRVISSAPNRWIEQGLPGELRSGLIRELVCSQSGELEKATRLIGGVILSAESWAGFEVTPVADTEWLELLNGRLTYEASATILDPEVQWQAFVIHQDAWRWRHSVEGLGLWRAWTNGYFRWAWSLPGHSENAKAIELSQDEGTRTSFALARVNGSPSISVEVENEGEDVLFSIAALLPRAEYRLLRIHSKDVKRDGSTVEWRFDRDSWERVSPALHARLGIEL